MQKRTFGILILILASFSGQSQNLSSIKLNDFFCCDLHSALNKIASENNVKFNYDVDAFKKIEFTDYLTNKPLDLFLQQVCREHELKYYIGQDSVVNIISKWQDLDQQPLQKTKTYNGPPSKSNITINGRVIDIYSHESLPFVLVTAKNVNNGTSSNVDGYFTMLAVPSDTSTIIFSYIGYQSKEIFLSPTMDLNNITVELEPEDLNIEEVKVIREKQEILNVNSTQASVIKMSPIKLNSLPNLGEKDILRSFQLMPGISAANESSSGLYVRGGTPDQVLVLYDGFTVYNVEHMFGFFSAFNSNAIKDVQLYKGGFDTKFGGRLSSVVEITGKEGNQKQFNAAADFSMMSVNGFVEFPIGKKISAIFSARRSWEGPLYNKIFDQFTDENEMPVMGGMGRFGGGTTQETKSYFYDLNGKITFKPTKNDIIALSIYNGKDNLDNSISIPAPPSFSSNDLSFDMENVDLTNWGNTGMSLKWSKQASKRLYINTLLSYSNYFSVRERSSSGSFGRIDGTSGEVANNILEDNNLNDYSFKSDFEYQLIKNNLLRFGIQATYNDIDYTYTQNDTTTVIDRSTEGETYSAYLQDHIYMLKEKLTLTPGLRYNYFTPTSKSYYEPRFNFMYSITDVFSLKGAAGKYYQFAKRVVREDITEGSRDFWVLSDDDKLPVSSSIQYVLGCSFNFDLYLIDIEGFYKDLTNITEYSLRIEPNRESGVLDYSEYFYTGTGVAQGIDFLFQKKLGKFKGWIAYTLSQVSYNIPEFGDYDFYASHDVTHEFKVVATYKWRKWDFGATWIYATGRPYTAPEGGYQLTLLDGTTADYINVSVKNGNRLPDYHRLDLSATYNFQFGFSPASLSFSLFNVYNRSNVWYNEYEIVDNEVIEVPVYYLGITPNVTLSVRLKK